MQTKLTLRLDDQLVKDVKQHARQTGKSLSQMVTEYFSAVTSPEAAPSELTPTVSKLKGVAAWSALPDWPTAETKTMWTNLAKSFMLHDNGTWSDRRYWSGVAWSGVPPPPGTPVQLNQWNGQWLVLAADGLPLGTLQAALNPHRRGLVRATVSAEAEKIDLVYLGPDDLSSE